jgi:hypothetical protein
MQKGEKWAFSSKLNGVVRAIYLVIIGLCVVSGALYSIEMIIMLLIPLGIVWFIAKRTGHRIILSVEEQLNSSGISAPTRVTNTQRSDSDIDQVKDALYKDIDGIMEFDSELTGTKIDKLITKHTGLFFTSQGIRVLIHDYCNFKSYKIRNDLSLPDIPRLVADSATLEAPELHPAPTVPGTSSDSPDSSPSSSKVQPMKYKGIKLGLVFLAIATTVIISSQFLRNIGSSNGNEYVSSNNALNQSQSNSTAPPVNQTNPVLHSQWQKAYADFLRNQSNYIVDLPGSLDEYERFTFALRDLTQDGIPELLIYYEGVYMAAGSGFLVYSYAANTIKFMGEIPTHRAFGNVFITDSLGFPGFFYLWIHMGEEYVMYVELMDGQTIITEIEYGNYNVEPPTIRRTSGSIYEAWKQSYHFTTYNITEDNIQLLINNIMYEPNSNTGLP